MHDAAPSARDWSLLSLDVISSIFIRLGAVDVLMGAGLACRSWLDAAKLPDVWRVVDMENPEVVFEKDKDVLCAMAKAAVDRSHGQLRLFAGEEFVTDELMKYIVERSPSLTSLRLVSCYGVFTTKLTTHVKESPLLELRSLELEHTDISERALTDVLESCPVLQVLNCFTIGNYDDHDALRAKFARIKNMTLEYDDSLDHECCSDDCCCFQDSNDDSDSGLLKMRGQIVQCDMSIL